MADACGKVSRVFVNRLLSERLLLYSDAETFYNAAKAQLDDRSDTDFASFLDGCRGGLQKFDLDIRKIYYRPGSAQTEDTEQRLEYIGIRNCNSDTIAQLATELSPQETQLFKDILDALKAKEDSFQMSLHEATSLLASKAPNLTKPTLQVFLDCLLANHWLHYDHRHDQLEVGPRAVVELAEFLKGDMTITENDAEDASVYSDCALCFNLITHGPLGRCTGSSCRATFHVNCWQEYLARSTANACPACQTQQQ